ncbi:hypothetical protein HK096_010786 [Nowakowskiella sp. JEL0078]|nr:hypothetical protein HK096_010786 [Nowakowskiella sp. JEL0078]
MWGAYQMEAGDRKEFLENSVLLKSNNKLRIQLNGLQRVYEGKVANFDSPLEKSIMTLKSIMADPLVGRALYEQLETVVNWLQANDLLTPDFKHDEQHDHHVDTLSQV